MHLLTARNYSTNEGAKLIKMHIQFGILSDFEIVLNLK